MHRRLVARRSGLSTGVAGVGREDGPQEPVDQDGDLVCLKFTSDADVWHGEAFFAGILREMSILTLAEQMADRALIGVMVRRIGERDRNRFLEIGAPFSSTGRFRVGGVLGDW